MNEVHRIPSPNRVQSVSGQGGTRDGKPHLERRQRRKKKGEEGDDAELLENEGEPTAKAEAVPRGSDDDEPEDEDRGKHVDTRA